MEVKNIPLKIHDSKKKSQWNPEQFEMNFKNKILHQNM